MRNKNAKCDNSNLRKYEEWSEWERKRREIKVDGGSEVWGEKNRIVIMIWKLKKIKGMVEREKDEGGNVGGREIYRITVNRKKTTQ